jgi:hypothetical protein
MGHSLIFEQFTVDRRIVSVTLETAAFLPTFTFGPNAGKRRERRDANPRRPA